MIEVIRNLIKRKKLFIDERERTIAKLKDETERQDIVNERDYSINLQKKILLQDARERHILKKTKEIHDKNFYNFNKFSEAIAPSPLFKDKISRTFKQKHQMFEILEAKRISYSSFFDQKKAERVIAILSENLNKLKDEYTVERALFKQLVIANEFSQSSCPPEDDRELMKISKEWIRVGLDKNDIQNFFKSKKNFLRIKNCQVIFSLNGSPTLTVAEIKELLVNGKDYQFVETKKFSNKPNELDKKVSQTSNLLEEVDNGFKEDDSLEKIKDIQQELIEPLQEKNHQIKVESKMAAFPSPDLIEVDNEKSLIESDKTENTTIIVKPPTTHQKYLIEIGLLLLLLTLLFYYRQRLNVNERLSKLKRNWLAKFNNNLARN